MRTFLAVALILWCAPAARAAEPLFALQDACVRCHLVEERQQSQNTVLAWKRSVHFRAESSCADCHGGDRLLYMDFKKGHMGVPSRAEALAACGRCHEKEASLAASRPLATVKGPACPADCVTCHGFHEVKKPDPSMLNKKNCGTCHAMGGVEKILGTARAARERLDALQADLDARLAAHLPSRRARRQLDEARELNTATFHGTAPENMAAAFAGEVLPRLENVSRSLERTEPGRWRLQGAVVTGFLLLALVGVIVYRQKLGN